MTNQPGISDAEWAVMNIVWEDQPVTASEIIKRLSDKNEWSAATIRTFLHRLVKKGALEYETQGNRYVYRAAVRKSSSIKTAARAFLDSVFDGQSGPLLAHFVKSQRLSKEELQQLRELLDEKA